ncbi:MAG: 1-acyl-sn-glycerol-3-phosphate acyltransferase [Bacteroidales bacterium]|jgi:1-acyl-sn-glycerol-3-phosphate acyltransferase|nr:1-acyl-sn-glycerol-3-phosphate acyltransferase [Bacteroidales bacterium]
MISFENVDKSGIKYLLLNRYVQIVHNFIFYKKYYVLHRNRIPKNAPIVLICNHQNGLSDALGLIFALNKGRKTPVFIARADIFKKDIIGKLLRFIRIMPAYRVVDTGKENLGENTKIFNKSARILLNNGIVGLFPEAGHEDCHHLSTFKKGFARIAFQAAEMSNFETPIHILPCSNHYSDYFGFQNKLIITIGEPFTFEEFYDIYKQHPERAQKLLADKARTVIKPMMLDIEDKNLYEEYDIIRTIYAKILVKKQGKKVSYYPNIFEAEKTIVSSLNNLKNNDEENYTSLMISADRYTRLLDKIHLNDIILADKFNFIIFILRFFIAIMISPFMIYGFVNNFIAYYVSHLFTRKIKDQMLHASFHFAICTLVTFPVCYIAASVTVWCITGIWWIALLYFISLPISLIIYLESKELWQKQLQRFRRFKYWIEGFYLYREACELRKLLIEKLDKIVDL